METVLESIVFGHESVLLVFALSSHASHAFGVPCAGPVSERHALRKHAHPLSTPSSGGERWQARACFNHQVAYFHCLANFKFGCQISKLARSLPRREHVGACSNAEARKWRSANPAWLRRNTRSIFHRVFWSQLLPHINLYHPQTQGLNRKCSRQRLRERSAVVCCFFSPCFLAGSLWAFAIFLGHGSLTSREDKMKKRRKKTAAYIGCNGDCMQLASRSCVTLDQIFATLVKVLRNVNCVLAQDTHTHVQSVNCEL